MVDQEVLPSVGAIAAVVKLLHEESLDLIFEHLRALVRVRTALNLAEGQTFDIGLEVLLRLGPRTLKNAVSMVAPFFNC